MFWITRVAQDSRTQRNAASEQPSCELAQLERSQAAGRAVLSQAEGSPRLYPVSGQPVANAQQKSTGAGQVQRYFLRFILPASGSLEFRDFLIQSCIFISGLGAFDGLFFQEFSNCFLNPFIPLASTTSCGNGCRKVLVHWVCLL